MADNTALRPKAFNIQTFLAEEKASDKGATKEEGQLYALTKMNGWRVFTEYTQRVMDELDQINTEAISQGKSFDEIGRNTLVISLAKDIVRKIISKVEDAKEACEQQIDKKQK